MRKKEARIEDYEALVAEPPPDPSTFEACDYMIEHLGRELYIAGTVGNFVAMTDLPGETGGLLGYYLKPDVVHAAARPSP